MRGVDSCSLEAERRDPERNRRETERHPFCEHDTYAAAAGQTFVCQRRAFPQNECVKFRFLWLIAAFCLACALPARALINIEMPVPKIFEESKAVIVGAVTAVNADNRVIDLKTTNMAKGEPAIETFRVQIAAPT